MYCQYISWDKYFVKTDIKNIDINAVNILEKIWEIVFEAIFLNIYKLKKNKFFL